MRKVDVFGKKQNLTRPFYLIILIFAVVLPGYFVIQNYFTVKTEELTKERLNLQSQVNKLLLQSEQDVLLEIDQIIPYLPTSFSQNAVSSELNSVRDLSGLTLATDYATNFVNDSVMPFDSSLPSTLKAVKITVSMSVDDGSKTLEYLDNLMDVDTIYYIADVSVNYLANDNAQVVVIFYTFYNDIIVN